MAMIQITKESKDIFFKNIRYIQKRYEDILKESGFDKAEKYKLKEIKEYLKNNKDRLLKLREDLIHD